jgi:hypothetical protein
MGQNPSQFKGDANRPAEKVSWQEAVLYCEKLTQRERSFGRISVQHAYRLPTEFPIRLITNGSHLNQARVQQSIAKLAAIGGEVWFKVDGGSSAMFARINNVALTPARVIRNLRTCADLCPTWVQTCMFAFDGVGPQEADVADYIELLRAVGVERLKGVLLYGVARASHQPEAPRLSSLKETDMEAVAQRIRQAGLTVRVSP